MQFKRAIASLEGTLHAQQSVNSLWPGGILSISCAAHHGRGVVLDR